MVVNTTISENLFANQKMALFNEYPDVVTPEDLQKMLNIGRNKVYSLLKNNDIKYKRIGRQYKIPKLHVIEYLMS